MAIKNFNGYTSAHKIEKNYNRMKKNMGVDVVMGQELKTNVQSKLNEWAEKWTTIKNNGAKDSVIWAVSKNRNDAVMIGFSQKFFHEIQINYDKILRKIDGRMLVVPITWRQQKYNMVNIYAPSGVGDKALKIFFEKVKFHLKKLSGLHVLGGGPQHQF